MRKSLILLPCSLAVSGGVVNGQRRNGRSPMQHIDATHTHRPKRSLHGTAIQSSPCPVSHPSWMPGLYRGHRRVGCSQRAMVYSFGAALLRKLSLTLRRTSQVSFSDAPAHHSLPSCRTKGVACQAIVGLGSGDAHAPRGDGMRPPWPPNGRVLDGGLSFRPRLAGEFCGSVASGTDTDADTAELRR